MTGISIPHDAVNPGPFYMDAEWRIVRDQIDAAVELEIVDGKLVQTGSCRGMQSHLYNRIIAETKARSDRWVNR